MTVANDFNPDEAHTKNIDPVMMVYSPYGFGGIENFLKISMPNATILPELSVSGALHTLEQQETMPEAYFIDAPVFGSDRIAVDHAIEILEKHKTLAGEGSHAPYVFLSNANSKSPEVSKWISDRTGLSVNLLEKELGMLVIDFIKDGVLDEDMTTFSPFVESTKKIYSPSISEKPLHQAQVEPS